MRKHQIENAAYEVATQVRAVEEAIDATLAEIAELQARMMHANALARVGPEPIHAALTDVSSAFSSMIAARGSIVSCHGELVTAKGKVPGLRTVGFGDEGDCPPKTAQADLRVVA
jgi:hypothetical protein